MAKFRRAWPADLAYKIEFKRKLKNVFDNFYSEGLANPCHASDNSGQQRIVWILVT